MPAMFHWNMEILQGKSFAQRAKECRRVAKVCPKHLRESYLEMAAEYEGLANQDEQQAQGERSRPRHGPK